MEQNSEWLSVVEFFSLILMNSKKTAFQQKFAFPLVVCFHMRQFNFHSFCYSILLIIFFHHFPIHLLSNLGHF